MRNALAYFKMRRSLLIAFVLLITHAALLPGLARADISTGLVGWWKFDEGTSTKTHDSSGNGFSGTLATDGSIKPQWVSGKLGKGLHFDGSSSYIATNNTTLNGATTLTVSFWEKPTVFGGGGSFSSSEVGSGSLTTFGTAGPAYQGYSNTFAATIHVSSGINVVGTVMQNNFPAGVWYHYVAVYDGTQTGNTNRLKVYINGVQQTLAYDGTIPATSYDNGTTLLIGKDNFPRYYNGTLDDVRIYNRALSAADVAQLYASGEAIIRKPANNLGLVAYWNFNEGTSTIAHDFSGRGNNGTLSTAVSTLPQWVSGKFGNALLFDGSSSYVNTNAVASSIASGPFTISMWFKPAVTITSGSSGGQDLFSLDDSGSNNDVFLQLNQVSLCNNGQLCGIENDGSSNWGSGSTQTTWLANTWYHAVYTFSTTAGGNLYVNGALQGSSPPHSRGGSPSAISTVGAGHLGASSYVSLFNGAIDDVRIYNRELSASEVANLYQSGGAVKVTSAADMSNGSTLQQGLVGHWTFDGKDTPWSSATAGTAIDRSGNGNNGTLNIMTRSGSPTIGKLGQALKFDGTSDISITPMSSIATKASICAWIKTTASPGVSAYIFAQKASGDNANMDLVQAGTNQICLSVYPGTDIYGTSAINTGKWVHVCGTRDSAAYNVYVNGALENAINNGTTLAVASDGQGTIGSNSGGNKFTGSLDDVRVYNRALSAAEVHQLFKLGQSTIRP